MRGTAINQRKSSKDPLERYYTPAHVARAHLDWVSRHAAVPLWGRCVVDPCAGEGVYLGVAAERYGASVRGLDIAPAAAGIVRGDALASPLPEGDVCITNPPFSLLPLLLPRIAAYETTSLLLPISALERTKGRRGGLGRAAMWDAHPPSRVAHVGRVKFTGPSLTGKTSGAAMAYVFVLWERGYAGGCAFEWLDIGRGGAL